jgi:hypothetical protein
MDAARGECPVIAWASTIKRHDNQLVISLSFLIGERERNVGKAGWEDERSRVLKG